MPEPQTGQPASRWAEHTVGPGEAGLTVQQVLTGPMRISRRRIQKLTRSRGIRLNRKAAFLAKKVKPGDVVAARVAGAEETVLEPVPMELDIVHEDAELLVVNKPPFLLVHPTRPEHRATLSHGIAAHFARQGLQTKVRPVHRLDRDTSGLLLVAKTAVAHHRLDQELREGRVQRAYLALVHGAMEEESGTIDTPIGKHPRHPHLRVVRPDGGDPAVTRYRILERFEGATLVQTEPETGRTHQLRVHLAHLGHPVLGDRQYGGRELSPLKRQALHAWCLGFRHPGTGEPVCLEAPPPEDIARVLATLRNKSVEPGKPG